MMKRRERSEERRHHSHRRSRSPKRENEDRKPSLRELKEYARREMEHRPDGGGSRYRDHKDLRDHRGREDRSDRNRHQERRPKPYEPRRPERNPSPSSRKDQGGDSSPPPEPLPEIRPNFELSGALARDTNTVNGVVVKYNEPGEAKKPLKKWRLYPFKDDKPLEHIEVHRQSAYLFGRDRKVADIPIDHPSCSKQHAVLQFRSIEIERPDGTKKKRTKPYIIDLESANKTFVNKTPIEPRRYVELLEKDVIQFGFSTREYVLLHESSNEDDQQIHELDEDEEGK